MVRLDNKIVFEELYGTIFITVADFEIRPQRYLMTGNPGTYEPMRPPRSYDPSLRNIRIRFLCLES